MVIFLNPGLATLVGFLKHWHFWQVRHISATIFQSLGCHTYSRKRACKAFLPICDLLQCNAIAPFMYSCKVNKIIYLLLSGLSQIISLITKLSTILRWSICFKKTTNFGSSLHAFARCRPGANAAITFLRARI